MDDSLADGHYMTDSAQRRTKPHPKSVQLCGAPGDVAVFDARVFHTGMPNFSKDDSE